MTWSKRQIVILVGISGLLTAGFQACSPGNYQGSSGVQSGEAGAGKGFDMGASLAGGTSTDNPKPTLDIRLDGYTEPGSASQQSGAAQPQLCLGEIVFGQGDTSTAPPAPQSQQAREPSSRDSGGLGSMIAKLFSSQAANLEKQLAALGAQFNILFSESFEGESLDVTPEGSLVRSIPYRPGSYNRVDVRLEPSCGGSSLKYMSALGSTTLQEPVTLHFVGNLDLSGGQSVLTLKADRIFSALRSTRSVDEAKSILQSEIGSF